MEPELQEIHPGSDPDIIYIAAMLKRLKKKNFFGTVTLTVQNGRSSNLKIEQNHKIPSDGTLREIPDAGLVGNTIDKQKMDSM
jgi:hypothetical protein